MNHRHLLNATALALAALTGLAAQAADRPVHWGYRGGEGPAHWGELDPAFEACAKGASQSPIDIRQTEKADLPALDFSYGASEPTLVNTGHAVQVNLPAGNRLKVGDKSYELLQFHFHAPSEEALHGKRTAMVAHFVHKDANGALGVVGVLLQPGKTNPAFGQVFAHLPRAGERVTVDGLKLDLAALLPAAKGYYEFAGSLTTPPCSESVSWMVLKQPVTLGEQQIEAFRKLFPANARPTQPLNGRVVRESAH